MRLFFFFKSRAKNRYRRDIDPSILDFYQKRSIHSKKNRVFLNSVFNWYLLNYGVRIGSVILYFTLSVVGLKYISIQEIIYGMERPSATQVQKPIARWHVYPVIIKKNKQIFIGKRPYDHSNKRVETFKEIKWENPRAIIVMIVDENVPMELVYTVIKELSTAELRIIYFGAKAENTLITE